mgnify:CR=1 FL=1
MEKQKFSARVKQAMGEASITNLYQLNGMVPVHKAIPFGLQHILAMFVANIAPILIVGGACGLAASDMAMLIQSAMLIAGIGTLVQLFPIFHKIGSGLPIVMGISFTFVSVLCFIGAQYGYGAIMGAVLIGGIVEGILGLFAKFWIRIIAPIVSASVVTAIGFSLLTVGATSFGGGSGSADFGSAENWILGSVTLLCCILFHIFAKSYFKQLSVLFGLVVGYILAVFMGKVDFSALRETSIIAVPHLMPFRMEFHADAILSVVLIFLVSATETIGDTSALAAISSRISVKGGIFNDSLTLINSPSRSSLKRNPPIREKSSIPVKKSKDDNLRIGRFSSAAAICSRRNNKVRPQRSGKASEKHPNISLSGCVYCCPG